MKKYAVWAPGWDQTIRDAKYLVDCFNPEEAVRRWAMINDQNPLDKERFILSGARVTVFVKRIGSKELRKYRVVGKMVPDYVITDCSDPEHGS